LNLHCEIFAASEFSERISYTRDVASISTYQEKVEETK
jgi:hypothetical protein